MHCRKLRNGPHGKPLRNAIRELLSVENFISRLGHHLLSEFNSPLISASVGLDELDSK